MKNIHPFFYILFFLTLGGFVTYGWRMFMRQRFVCEQLNCIRMNGLSTYQEKEIYSNTPLIYRALFSHDERLLRIEARQIAANSAAQELNASVTKMKAMFENAPAPYPGEISDTVSCDQKFVPTYTEMNNNNSRLNVFVGYLNNRLTFGSCSLDQAVYKGALIFTYCPQTSLIVRLELIAPTHDFETHETEIMEQIKTFRCST